MTFTTNNNHLPLPSFILKKRDMMMFEDYQLPPIQFLLQSSNTTPPPYSPISSIASSPTPEEEDDYPRISTNRKGSIASILNSDPELKLLDQSKSNYQSHFGLKRGRPKQEHHHHHPFEAHCKKQRQYLSNETRAIKGLRHFSKQVCDKVAEKGITTYNEVADDLALDIQQSCIGNKKQTYDQKNIRRRVYDALNVLMAMNIITKDKKVIKWLGYEQEDEQVQSLLQQIEQEERRQNELVESIDDLRLDIKNKLNKQANIHSLIYRNKSLPPMQKDEEKVHLPFFLVASNNDNVNINVHPDRKSAIISFQHTNSNDKVVFEDTDILDHLLL